MKKILISAAAIAMFAGCAKNEVINHSKPNPNTIGINGTIGQTGRANNNGLDQLKGTEGFYVMAVEPFADDLDATAVTSIFAEDGDGSTISSFYKFGAKTASVWGWIKETDDKKWPSDVAKYPITFSAYYPASLGAVVTGAGKTRADAKKAIEIKTDIAQQEDILVAVKKVATRTPNGMVDMTFKHILSKMNFKIASTKGYKVVIQGIKLTWVAKDGRSFDFLFDYNAQGKTLADAYSADKVQAASSYVPFVHFASTGSADLKTITYDATPVAVEDATGNSLKLLPQTLTPAWSAPDFKALLASFVGTAAADWATWLADGTNQTKYDEALGGGMKIELIYRMEDNTGKSIVGWKTGEEMSPADQTENLADKDYFVRVGYSVDLSTLDNGGTGTGPYGWYPSKQYTYTISLGTPDASNGTLLEPIYRDNTGTETDKPVDNPNVKPGDPVTDTDGYIGFTVSVDEWVDGGSASIK